MTHYRKNKGFTPLENPKNSSQPSTKDFRLIKTNSSTSRKNSLTGFTLIELLVVISIIGLLSSIVLASLRSAKVKAQNAKLYSDVHQLQVALELYASDNNGTYPSPNLNPDNISEFDKSTLCANPDSCYFYDQIINSAVYPHKSMTDLTEERDSSLVMSQKEMAAVLTSYIPSTIGMTTIIPIGGQNFKGVVYVCGSSNRDTNNLCITPALYFPVIGNSCGGPGGKVWDDGINSLCRQPIGAAATVGTCDASGCTF